MKTFQITAWATVAIALLASLALMFTPVPHGSDPANFYINFVFSVATAILYSGASVVLVMGFGAFTDRLRRPYLTISLGLIMWGLAYLELPVLVIFQLVSDNLAIIIAALIPIAGGVLIFSGTRKLAEVFEVKSISTSWWFAIVVQIIANTLMALAVIASPVVPSKFDSAAGDIALMIPGVFMLLGSYHVLLIKRRTSITFTNALAWLWLSMIFSAAVSDVGSLIVSLFVSLDYAGLTIVNMVTTLPSFLAGIFYLRSTYSFNKIVDSTDVQGAIVERDFFGKPKNAALQSKITSLSIVEYAASLVSYPHGIQQTMGKISDIAAKGGQALTAEDEAQLMQIYLSIEDYLIKEELIRVFSRDKLRSDIAQKLHLLPSASGTFWSRLAQANA